MKITTGVFFQESPSTLHVTYRTVKHWICPFNPNFIYEFLGQTLVVILVQNLQQKGWMSSTIVGEKVAPFAKEVDKIGHWRPLRNDKVRHNGLLSLFMPSNLTRSKCQLQALHGNEARFVVLSYPNLSVGYETPSCVSTACWYNKSYAPPWMEQH